MNQFKISNVDDNNIKSYAGIIHEEMGFTIEEAICYLREKDLNKMLCIEADGKPVGFLNYSVDGGTIYIGDLDVADKFRRKGYGSALLRHLEQTRGKGRKKMRLHVNVDNDPAIKFYLKNKYHEKERIENYYADGVHALVFEKTLLAPVQ